AVLLEQVRDGAEAVIVADRVLASLSRPARVGDQQVVPRASVGLALAGPGTTADELVRDADVAMYHAKRKGAGGYEQFEPSMRELVVLDRALEADLRVAVDEGQFELVYQPILRLGSETPDDAVPAAACDSANLTGAEALLRWRHPTRGPVAPGEFIAVAERTGVIVPIGRWVVRAACREAAGWPPGPHGPLTVAVNVSARQLADPGLLEDVAGALAVSGLAPHRLLLEITETALADGSDVTLGRLRALKALGVQLAIDDFGTGYSSLAYLQRFPVDVLKIDKAFVDGVHGTATSGPAIVRAIVALGHALGLRTVGEGVETAAQCAALRALGCGYGQGYLFARPLPPGELAARFGAAAARREAGLAGVA
ncbi:MAG TPA: GGDEF domain-containing phosphodiesterase, partial [Gemmatirosa sp.]